MLDNLRSLCPSCGARKALRRRNLCRRCWSDPTVRSRFPTAHRRGRGSLGPRGADPGGDTRALAAALEVPDCDCGPDDDCPHAAQAPVHGLSNDEWFQLLRAARPEDYPDRPHGQPVLAPPGSPAKQRALAERARRRQPLFHPCDALADLE